MPNILGLGLSENDLPYLMHRGQIQLDKERNGRWFPAHYVDKNT